MAPITLLFGVNSSGKSSLGQFLMMLKQTVQSPDRKAVFYPGDRNSAVQLGSYQDMVYRRNPTKKIAFEYEWGVPELLRIRDPISRSFFSGNILSFKCQVGIEDSEGHSVSVDRLKYSLFDEDDDEASLSIGMERRPGHKSEYDVEADEYTLRRKRGRGWYPKGPVRFYGFPDEVVAYHQNADFVQELNLQHERLFNSLSYLGPLRTRGERLYSWTGNEPEGVGYAGENAIAAILAAEKRRISLGYKRRSKLFSEIIGMKLKEMGLIEGLRVLQISQERQQYEVKVRTHGSLIWVDLPDVGFGISQVLPVLVQCFYAPHHSIIIMEQPELHLHPSAQAALADVLIDVINSRENGQERSIQLIIESHSEHFLRRLQRRIAENRIEKERISAYFADVSGRPAALRPLEIDAYGNILNWPQDFFGDEMGDISAHAMAAMQKRIDQR